MPTNYHDEVVKALNSFGPAAVIDICLPSILSSITTDEGQFPAPFRDPLRDSYLARALAIHMIGDWFHRWRRISRHQDQDLRMEIGGTE